MPDEEPRLRPLQVGDIPFSLEETAREGWDTTADVFHTALTMSPEFCFLAELVFCPRNNLTIDGGALCCRHVYSSDSFTG